MSKKRQIGSLVNWQWYICVAIPFGAIVGTVFGEATRALRGYRVRMFRIRGGIARRECRSVWPLSSLRQKTSKKRILRSVDAIVNKEVSEEALPNERMKPDGDSYVSGVTSFAELSAQQGLQMAVSDPLAPASCWS